MIKKLWEKTSKDDDIKKPCVQDLYPCVLAALPCGCFSPFQRFINGVIMFLLRENGSYKRDFIYIYNILLTVGQTAQTRIKI